MRVLEELAFDQKGLVPSVIQDADSLEVLMVAYMSKESLRLTLQTGETHFWSRSRECVWHKGETSGNIQRVREILFDCDCDTLLIKVDQCGNACHTGRRSCFYRRADARTGSVIDVEEVG